VREQGFFDSSKLGDFKKIKNNTAIPPKYRRVVLRWQTQRFCCDFQRKTYQKEKSR
jgi:hypothetical protein